MKQNFDNAGFANMQASVLNLPYAMRQVVTNRIRTDMDGWLLDSFEMNSSQQLQLQDLSPIFKEQIADALADSWDAGLLVLFDKQEQALHADKPKEQTPKDVVLEKLGVTSQNVQSQHISQSQQVVIRIQYR